MRVNVLSGLLGHRRPGRAHEISNGNTAKYFGAILGIAVSTTLISYIGASPRCGGCA